MSKTFESYFNSTSSLNEADISSVISYAKNALPRKMLSPNSIEAQKSRWQSYSVKNLPSKEESKQKFIAFLQGLMPKTDQVSKRPEIDLGGKSFHLEPTEDPTEENYIKFATLFASLSPTDSPETIKHILEHDGLFTVTSIAP